MEGGHQRAQNGRIRGSCPLTGAPRPHLSSSPAAGTPRPPAGPWDSPPSLQSRPCSAQTPEDAHLPLLRLPRAPRERPVGPDGAAPDSSPARPAPQNSPTPTPPASAPHWPRRPLPAAPAPLHTPPPTAKGSSARRGSTAAPGARSSARPLRGGLSGTGPAADPRPRVPPWRPTVAERSSPRPPLASGRAAHPAPTVTASPATARALAPAPPRSGRAAQPCPDPQRPLLPPAATAPPPPRPLCSPHWLPDAELRPTAPLRLRIGPGEQGGGTPPSAL